jgi:hypothetical protein
VGVGSVLIDLIPLIIGAGVVPVYVILVLILLRGAGGLVKALAFAGGAI